MRLVPQLVEEFEGLCAHYNQDPRGKDIVVLTKTFGDTNDRIRENGIPDFAEAWAEFLDKHKNVVTVEMVGMIIYLLVTYWQDGQLMFEQLPVLEQMLLRDTWFELQDEIERQSALNGRRLQPTPE